MSATIESHLEIDADGRAWIIGANTKVSEVVLDKLAYGWSPEEMQLQHPHLSLSQIHAALSYYYDHQTEVDREIERQLEEYREARSRANDSPLRKKLRTLGKLA